MCLRDDLIRTIQEARAGLLAAQLEVAKKQRIVLEAEKSRQQTHQAFIDATTAVVQEGQRKDAELRAIAQKLQALRESMRRLRRGEP